MSSIVARPTLLRVLALLAALCLANAALAADTLVVGQSMSAGQRLDSANGSYRFVFQTDSNLVVRRVSDSAALWASNTNGQGGSRLTLQNDGNLVLYTSSNAALWSSRTAGTTGNRLIMQNDGNLTLYNASNAVIWSTNSGAEPPPGGGTVTHVGTVLVETKNSSLSITRPSSVQPGDLMILFTQGGDGQLPDTVSGWTRFARCFERTNSDATCNDTGADLGLVAYYRVASTSGAASYTVNRGNAGHVIAAMVVVRGANTGNPIYSYTYLPRDGTGSASVCPSTAGVTGGHHICAFAHDDPQIIDGFSPLSFRGRILSGGDYVHMATRTLSVGGGTGSVRADNVNVLGPGEGRNDLQLAVVIRPAP